MVRAGGSGPRGTSVTSIVHRERETKKNPKPIQIEKRNLSHERMSYRYLGFCDFELFLVTKGLVHIF